jgi:hypothetical protein
VSIAQIGGVLFCNPHVENLDRLRQQRACAAGLRLLAEPGRSLGLDRIGRTRQELSWPIPTPATFTTFFPKARPFATAVSVDVAPGIRLHLDHRTRHHYDDD